jgi:soluble lytic murein transglycosylase-like protein
MIRIILTSALALAVALPAVAADKSRHALYQRQTAVLDQRFGDRGTRISVETGKAVASGISVSERLPRYDARNRSQFESAARAAARKHGVPEDLFLRLVTQESGWNPRARSPKGAMGLAQLMPQTARVLRVDPSDPHQNLEGGARYLALQYRSFGSWRLALAAYNAGPEAVQRHNGVPPYRETQGYVRAIMGS